MGIARYIGNPTPVRCDLIPVDIVSNMIIVATVYQANTNSMNIINAGTSYANPVILDSHLLYSAEYTATSPFDNTYRAPSINHVKPQLIPVRTPSYTTIIVYIYLILILY